MEECGSAPRELLQRKPLHWDVVINDRRSSRKCHVFKEILGKWIHKYRQEGAKESLLQSIQTEMTQAGVRFLVREQNGFVLAQSNTDILDCIERALRQTIKTESNGTKTTASSPDVPASQGSSSGSPAVPFRSPLPQTAGEAAQMRGLQASFPVNFSGNVLYTPPAIRQASSEEAFIQNGAVKRVRAQEGLLASVPRRSLPPLSPLPRHRTSRSDELEVLVRRLEAEKAVLEIRTERLEVRVQRLETVVLGLGQSNQQNMRLMNPSQM